MDASYEAPVTPPDKSDEAGKTGTVDEENAQGNTTVVPNKILSPHGEPLKEGDEIVVRVVAVHDNESEIEYAPHKEQEREETSETGKDYMGEAGEELAALDKGE